MPRRFTSTFGRLFERFVRAVVCGWCVRAAPVPRAVVPVLRAVVLHAVGAGLGHVPGDPTRVHTHGGAPTKRYGS
ncbi:hypothetical protein GCM10010282_21600 [Streptomyces roseolus]|nr:hypothetical protein GCM10010282_21600 [Streptomyces roseolus]